MDNIEKGKRKDHLKLVSDEPDTVKEPSALSRRKLLFGAGALGAAAAVGAISEIGGGESLQAADQKTEKEKEERLREGLEYLKNEWHMRVEVKELHQNTPVDPRKEYVTSFPGTREVHLFDLSEVVVHPLRGVEIPLAIVPPDPFGTESDRISLSKSHEQGLPKIHVDLIEQVVRPVDKNGEIDYNVLHKATRVTLEKDADGKVHVVPMVRDPRHHS